MRKILIVILAGVAGYYAWQDLSDRFSGLEPLYEMPYVVVYGRRSCGWTQKYLRDLRVEGFECIFENVDEKGVGEELHPRMEKAGIDTRRYRLPVIDVNAEIFVRPDLETILVTYDDYDETD